MSHNFTDLRSRALYKVAALSIASPETTESEISRLSKTCSSNKGHNVVNAGYSLSQYPIVRFFSKNNGKRADSKPRPFLSSRDYSLCAMLRSWSTAYKLRLGSSTRSRPIYSKLIPKLLHLLLVFDQSHLHRMKR